MRWSWGDRRHWVIGLGRVELERWCPGAPCRMNEAYRRHPIRLIVYRRTGAARFDT